MKLLKRHLKPDHDMNLIRTVRSGALNADYPVIATNYAQQRRDLAKSTGLGTKRRKKRKVK